METPRAKFQCAKCIGAEVSYKSVIFELTLIWCLCWVVVVDSDTFSYSKLYYSEL